MNYHKKKNALAIGRWAVLVIFAASFFIPAIAWAHSMFIQASRYQVALGKSSPMFFCYGHHIPVDDGVRRAKLKSVKLYTPDGRVEDIRLRNETSLHSYMIKYDRPGTYVLTAETNPGYYTVYIDKKGRERHTIKSLAAVKDKAAEVKNALYSKQYAKTYVVCDEPSAKFPSIVGLSLELAPLGDINKLQKGDTLKFRVYRNGKPYEGEGYWDATFNGYSTQAEDMYIQRRKSTGGVIEMPIDHTGRWFLRFFIKTQSPQNDRGKCLHAKQTATLVFEVPNERKRPKNKEH